MGRLKTLACPSCGVTRPTKAEGRQRLACRGCGRLYAVSEAPEVGSTPAGSTPASSTPAGSTPASSTPVRDTGAAAGSPGLGEVRVAAFEEVVIPPPRRGPRRAESTRTPLPPPQVDDLSTPTPSPSPATPPAGSPPAPAPSTPLEGSGRRRPAGGPGYYLGARRG